MSTPRLRPTERIRSARSHAMSSPGCHVGSESPDPQPPGTPASSRPPSGAQKRKLLRPPSAPVSFSLEILSFFKVLKRNRPR